MLAFSRLFVVLCHIRTLSRLFSFSAAHFLLTSSRTYLFVCYFHLRNSARPSEHPHFKSCNWVLHLYVAKSHFLTPYCSIAYTLHCICWTSIHFLYSFRENCSFQMYVAIWILFAILVFLVSFSVIVWQIIPIFFFFKCIYWMSTFGLSC